MIFIKCESALSNSAELCKKFTNYWKTLTDAAVACFFLLKQSEKWHYHHNTSFSCLVLCQHVLTWRKTLRLLLRLTMDAHNSPSALPHSPLWESLPLSNHNSGLLSSPAFLQHTLYTTEFGFFYIYINTQTKQAMGLCLYIYKNSFYNGYKCTIMSYLTYCWTITRSATHPFLIISS